MKSRYFIPALFVSLLCAGAARATPIDVVFTSNDGVASGRFLFDPAGAIVDTPTRLTSASLSFGSYSFDEDDLRYEYYQILDSLSVSIFANEATGLGSGEFVTLRLSNPDGPRLALPSPAELRYALDGKGGVYRGTVSAASVPEPAPVALLAFAAAMLVLRRGRRSAALKAA